MDTAQQIAAYLAAQPAAKRADMEALRALMQRLLPGAREWFLDGTDADGRTVTNPSIGYGEQQLRSGSASRPFYQLGLSANTSGLSVYIMGLADRTYLPATYAATIGKAKVTGYCITFRSLQHVDTAVLEAAMRDGVARTSG